MTELQGEKDYCVMPGCKNSTRYAKDTPIDRRLHYIEGSGQLCAICYVKIYGPCGCAECAEITGSKDDFFRIFGLE